jgi:hypothetical protein
MTFNCLIIIIAYSLIIFFSDHEFYDTLLIFLPIVDMLKEILIVLKPFLFFFLIVILIRLIRPFRFNRMHIIVE